jgi:hypothetical protein
MDMREFHRTLGESLDALDRASGAEERVKGAERLLANKQHEIDALSEAHAKLKKQSDDHLAANLARMNEETEKWNASVADLKRQHFALEQRNKEQIDNSSSMLTNINTEIGVRRKELDAMRIEHERRKNEAVEYANRLAGAS